MNLIGLCFGISTLIGAHGFHGDKYYRVVDISISSRADHPHIVIVSDCTLFSDKSEFCQSDKKSIDVVWRNHNDVPVLVNGDDSFYKIACPKGK